MSETPEAMIGAMEIASCNAWPATSIANCGGWQFRSANGYTKRANSACAISPSMPFQEVLREAEQFYSQIDQDVIFRLSPIAGDEPRRILLDNGYLGFDPCHVMIKVASAYEDFPHVVIVEGLDDSWLAGFTDASKMTLKQSEAHRKIVSNIRGRVACATVYQNEQAIGFGMAVMDGQLTGIFDVVVDSSHRRKGHGREVTQALCSWASQKCAKFVYLQVQEKNDAAIALYQDLNFSEAYSYSYFSRSKNLT